MVLTMCRKASGNVCVCSNDEDLEKKFRAGDIVAVYYVKR